MSAFGKALCLSASISWNPQKGESQESSFLIGFNSNISELNSSKVTQVYSFTCYFILELSLHLCELTMYSLANVTSCGKISVF